MLSPVQGTTPSLLAAWAVNVGAAVVSSVVVLLLKDAFKDALVALGGTQLLSRKAAIDGVVTREVSAGSARAAVLFDNPMGDPTDAGSCAQIEGNKTPSVSKAISTIIYLMKAY